MEEREPSSILLVGMEIGAVPVGNSVAVPQKPKNRVTI